MITGPRILRRLVHARAFSGFANVNAAPLIQPVRSPSGGSYYSTNIAGGYRQASHRSRLRLVMALCTARGYTPHLLSNVSNLSDRLLPLTHLTDLTAMGKDRVFAFAFNELTGDRGRLSITICLDGWLRLVLPVQTRPCSLHDPGMAAQP